METVPEIIAELNEIIGIYNAILERENNEKIAYLELLTAHNMTPLSRIGLWMPREFLQKVFLPFWTDNETQSYEPWRQIAAAASLLWLWLLTYPDKLSEVDKAYLKDQKMRLFFLIPDLLEKQNVSPYAKDPRMPIAIQFDESKFAYRCLIRSILDEDGGEDKKKIEKFKTLLH